jgi:hypothetical protein
MSKTKRLKRKRKLQKIANIHRMASKGSSGIMSGAHKLMKRMSRDHLDALQNIEFALITCYRDDHSIDDRFVADALQAAINDTVPEDPRAKTLNEAIENIRLLRSDVPDDVWRDGLRTVLQSVHRHSDRRPGATDYVDFVSDFVP